MVGLDLQVQLMDRPGPQLINTAVGLESSPEAAILAAAHAWLAGMHDVVTQVLGGAAPQLTWRGPQGS
ncbi:hypothetical protein [Deinococcus hohokamensis]|uniref:Uncharacterized protein n=1 Tax=Deinococcus hohokamensis TaxID=309883 RepID=A0ABV9IF25_9DEIO